MYDAPMSALALMLLSAIPAPAQGLPAIIPKPVKMTMTGGTLVIPSRARIVHHPSAQAIARRIAADLRPLSLGLTSGEATPGDVVLRMDPNLRELGAEGYRLSVDDDGIRIVSATPAGLFYGGQTLRQILVGGREAPHLEIEDRPRFPWRGSLLDVARHFRTKAFVKRYIDLLAYHKLNVLHWHLVDDQGWRMEVKKYPRLTEVGAWRISREGKRYGGFYSQRDIQEIVRYAAERFVTVVPEIEMPGHSMAALAAYPEHSCAGGPFTVPNWWGIYEDVYCPGKDSTFSFLEDVLEETLSLFPSRFIHIGGDEVPKTRWKACPRCQARMRAEGLKDEHELQSYFIRRVDRWLGAKGRRLLGWDEILEGGLAEGAAVQSWRGMEGALAAARMGHDVVASPTSHCYLDYSHETTPVEKSYSFEPVPAGLAPDRARHILGGEGNIWGEWTPKESDVDRQVWPRLTALSEVFWSPSTNRSWPEFQRRLRPHLARLAEMGVKYYVAPPRLVEGDEVFLDRTTVTLAPATPVGEVVYTTDGSRPHIGSARYTQPLTLTRTTTLQFATVEGSRVGEPARQVFTKTKLMPALGVAAKPWTVARYLGTWETLPDFAKLAPASTSAASSVNTSFAPRPENYALVFEGTMSVAADGVFTFFLASDDGSRLFVDGRLVVDNDGLHAAQEKRGQAALAKGTHLVRVEYFQAGGAASLALAVKPPHGARAAYP